MLPCLLRPELDPSDPALLVFAYVCEAEEGYRLTRSEFVRGMQELNCSSLEALKASKQQLHAHLDDDQTFREVCCRRPEEGGLACAALCFEIPPLDPDLRLCL